MSNVDTVDIGAVLLNDISRQAVVRAEVRESAALLASSFTFRASELEEMTAHPDFCCSLVQTTGDATGAGMFREKQK